MDASELLIANLELIDRVIGFTCRRQRLSEDDAEEFASTVKLKLVENDYAVLRKFEGRSSFATFISVVIQRMLLDYRVHLWGKWHPSAEAKRLGEAAVELEKLLFRDNRSIEEAAPILAGHDPAMTIDAVRQLAARIPPRGPRRRHVELEEAQSVAAKNGAHEVELEADRAVTSRRLSEVLARAMAGLSQQDRLVLQLRFENGLTVAQIAKALQLDQKLLYRRMEKHFRNLRTQLEDAGIAGEDALDLVGSTSPLDFGLGKAGPRPSTPDSGAAVAGQEGITR